MYADVCISIYSTDGGILCMNMQQNVSFMAECDDYDMITITCTQMSANPNSLMINVFCNQTV